jgi:hypothetical protein
MKAYFALSGKRSNNDKTSGEKYAWLLEKIQGLF